MISLYSRSTFRLLVILLAVWPAAKALAGARHFTYVYEAVTSAPGSVDFENWFTWERINNPERSNQIAFRHELEIGLTDHFQASIYLADWSYEHASSHSGFTYSDSVIELIYNLTNPVIDPLGLSVYQEYQLGDRFFEWESKVIAQKNPGRWVLAYNATVEAVWQGEGLSEREGEFQQAVGASYEICPRVSVGIEFLHEIVFPDWRDDEEIRNVFVGPNISFRHRNWFITATALAQATDTPGEAAFQLRTVFGVGF